MPRTRTAAKEREILDAAASAFAGRAYHKVRTEEIARRAKIGKGTIFRYFSTKEDLYFAAIVQGFSDLHRLLEAAAASETTPTRQLQRVGREIMSFFWHHRSFYWLLYRNERRFRSQETRMKKSREKVVRLVERIIADGIQSGELKAGDPRIAAELYLGMIRAMNLFRRDSDRIETTAAEVTSVFLHGLGREKEG